VNADGTLLYPASESECPPEYSDEALALAFAARHADGLRYVAPWSKWMVWTGDRWREDDSLQAFDHSRALCRGQAAGCNDRMRVKIASAQTVAAVERLARSDRRIASRIDQWDSDLWLLNTPDGTVDLRTGTMRPHSASDYITKTTAPSPGGDCPLWHQFLARLTGGDEGLTGYLQRLAG
jgi:putative DNA primase/helicase